MQLDHLRFDWLVRSLRENAAYDDALSPSQGQPMCRLRSDRPIRDSDSISQTLGRWQPSMFLDTFQQTDNQPHSVPSTCAMGLAKAKTTRSVCHENAAASPSSSTVSDAADEDDAIDVELGYFKKRALQSSTELSKHF